MRAFQQSLIPQSCQRLLAAVGFGIVMVSASATPSLPQNGVEYHTLEKPQNIEPGKKVEVTEFFWYACPHCFALEPALADWVKKQGDTIVFKRVPVHFRDSFIPQQKMYYALEAMGKSEELQKKIFTAIHVDRQHLDTEPEIMEFIGRQPGIDKQKFVDLFNAFGTQAKVRRALSLQDAYRIDSVPNLAIDGKYMTSPALAGASLGSQPEAAQGTAAVQVLDVLVAKARLERNGATTLASAAPAAHTAITAPNKMLTPAKDPSKR